MPPPSKIDQLPEPIRAELEQRIVANGFGGYVQLADWLAERGFEISKTTVGAHGKELKRHLDAVKASTQAAIAFEEAARDDADARSNAIYAKFQAGVFDALLAFSEAEGEVNPAKRLALLTKTGKDFAALGRANVAGKRWMMEVRSKLEAAAADVRKLAEGAGVSEETLAAIDRRLQGVV